MPFQYLRPEKIAALSVRQLGRYKDAAFDHWRSKGFPYPKLSRSQLEQQYRQFAMSCRSVFGRGRSITWSPLGLGIANFFHPHMWAVKCQYFRSPVQVFRNDTLLAHCIDRSLRINTDRTPLNANNMRVMLATFSNTKRVSNFRPTAARALYQRYSRDGDIIVDPSAGFGGRLLGALPLDREYIGIEPNTQSVKGMSRLLDALSGHPLTKGRGRVLQGRCETLLPKLPGRYAAMVISSPPYFARERYGRGREQSWVRYPEYEEWKTHFLASQMREIHRILQPGGFYCLNVENTETHAVADDAIAIARQFFRPFFVYKLMIGCVPYHRNGQRGGHRSERLLVFQKGR
ncbi:MAG: DNA methyltransferase [Candidatus Rokubacteria bacterium]|nr:DNA methyltransferase [Candidatus Rokubacteria bacterium]